MGKFSSRCYKHQGMSTLMLLNCSTQVKNFHVQVHAEGVRHAGAEIVGDLAYHGLGERSGKVSGKPVWQLWACRQDHNANLLKKLKEDKPLKTN